MPAVNNVLVVGGGARRRRHRDPARRGRRRRRPRRDQARRRRPRLRHHAAGQRPARAARSSACGTQVQAAGYAFDTLGLRAPDPAGTADRRDPRRQDRRPRPARHARHAAPRPGPDPARPGRRGRRRRSASARRSPTLTQDDAGVDVTFSDGSTGRYDLVVGADGIRSWTRRALGIDLETAADRHGHLAGVRPAAGQRHPHRPVLRRAVATSPATAPPARTRSTPTSSRPRRTARR